MAILVRIRSIIGAMKRSLVIIGATCSMSFIPVYAQAVSPSPSPLVTATASTISTPNPISKNAARAVAHQAFTSAMEQAQNGSDLAFADAKATWMQSKSTAGKDRVARKAALDSYRASVTGIVAAYKQAITQAKQELKTALASINGK